MKRLPVVALDSLTEKAGEHYLVSRFAPYLEHHHQLAVPHGHTFYHLVYFTAGSGTQMIDFEQFPIVPGQVYCMAPGQVHHWDFTSPADGYVMNFSPSFFHSFLLQPDYLDNFPFFRSIPSRSVFMLAPDSGAGIAANFEELIAGMDRDLSPDAVRVAMLRFFFLLSSTDSDDKKDDKSVSPYANLQAQLFRRLVDRHFLSNRLPKEYAGLMHITANHLNALSVQTLGKPAGEVIRERVLLEAKRLLINPAIPVTAIAGRLNFNDASYFSRFFKKLEGVSPEAFRKQQLKNYLS